MGSLFFNQDMKVSSSKKADTNKSNRNACWWRRTKRKDPNAMDVDTLTIEERSTLPHPTYSSLILVGSDQNSTRIHQNPLFLV
jgi:hypothetical protein